MHNAMGRIGIVRLERAGKLTMLHKCLAISRVRMTVKFSIGNFCVLFFSVSAENLCGWIHDTDHEVDFERRSGHNNKTIAMATGPHADHTTGIPFQGHYMVMNTNTEVSINRARLISPMYKVNATTMCFNFYYHMYGIGVGSLRVYIKPESVDMADVLRESTEIEASSDFVVFEISGKQKIEWK
jgi:hypothetical protein